MPSEDAASQGCGIIGGLAIIGGMFWLVHSCVSGDSKSPEELERELQQIQANRAAGLHCLSAWDGSHPRVVAQAKARLRDPDSFEHDRTILAPQDDNGDHELMMRYRARNGFGGMNVGYVRAKVSNASCDAWIIDME